MTDEQASAEAFHRYPDSEELRAAFIEGVFVYRALQERNMGKPVNNNPVTFFGRRIDGGAR